MTHFEGREEIDRDILAQILSNVERTREIVNEMQSEFSMLYQMVVSHSSAIQQLESKVSEITKYLMERQSEEIQNGEATKAKRKRHNVEEPKSNEMLMRKPMNNDCQIVSIPSTLIHPPFQKLSLRKGNHDKLNKLFNKFSSISINIPFMETLQDMPRYDKFMKDLVSKNCLDDETIEITHHCSAMMTSAYVKKKKDPGAFTISYTIGAFTFGRVLCDHGASVNVLPYAIFHKIGLVDFVIVDCPMDIKIPIILGRPFLATGKVLVDVEFGEM
ncbi:uncharacterized protein LOC124888882 [Capsicum annuum]|uniref:uncharacterized protein LOC124888882 n=1 Tax=Capsicum annuum TaxID=4072 RepID=UPI001FB14DD1|nr:uncharacterized protein LOC124888882 [Capsicum annuum]